MPLDNLRAWLRGQAQPLPGKLTVVPSSGRLTGPAKLSYNDPWPCKNGQWGSGAMRGVVMHTMVGNLPGTVSWFNQVDGNGDPVAKASAHFGVGQDGSIHQFGPVGKGWEAWAQEDGNPEWYSIEHADNGNPDNPLTYKQKVASAQLVECLSAFANFPLEVTDSTDGKGYGTHAMGGAAWGGHTCPDLPPKHVRSLQRYAIIALAKQIRQPAVRYIKKSAAGGQTLAELAKLNGVSEADIVEASITKLNKAEAAQFENVVAGKLLRGMSYYIKKG